MALHNMPNLVQCSYQPNERDIMAVLTKCNSFTDADHILGNRHRKKIGHNTYLQRNHSVIDAIYHSTAVVTYSPNGTMQASTGGWQTVTTKDRLNQLLPARVWSERGSWYTTGGTRFFDGIRFSDSGQVLNPLPMEDLQRVDKYNKEMKKSIKEYINGYIDELAIDGLPMPSNGDCWYCIGMMPDSTDHLLGHLDEKYYVPSLAVNALRETGYKDAGIFIFLDMQPEQDRMGGRSTDYGSRISADTIRRSMRNYLQKRLLRKV